MPSRVRIRWYRLRFRPPARAARSGARPRSRRWWSRFFLDRKPFYIFGLFFWMVIFAIVISAPHVSTSLFPPRFNKHVGSEVAQSQQQTSSRCALHQNTTHPLDQFLSDTDTGNAALSVDIPKNIRLDFINVLICGVFLQKKIASYLRGIKVKDHLRQWRWNRHPQWSGTLLIQPRANNPERGPKALTCTLERYRIVRIVSFEIQPSTGHTWCYKSKVIPFISIFYLQLTARLRHSAVTSFLLGIIYVNMFICS